MNSVHKICFRKMDYEVSVFNSNDDMQMRISSSHSASNCCIYFHVIVISKKASIKYVYLCTKSKNWDFSVVFQNFSS